MHTLKYAVFLLFIFFATISQAQSAKSLVSEGFELEKNKDYKGAINKYTEAIALNEQNKYHLEALFFRGNCSRETRNYTQVRDDYNAAVELYEKLPNKSPRFIANLCFNRALSRLEFYRYEEAMEDLNVVIENTPADALAYAYRGYIKYELKDKKGACDDFAKAKKLNSKSIRPSMEKAYKKSKNKCK